jgi:nicotinate phosphoribosyltransferase
LFSHDFLEYLKSLSLGCDVDAIPEGTVVFAQEPLLRVKGPVLQAQLLETALLNIINFQTLIATKASRIVQAARGAPVMEFGLRRAQGVDGAITAARAAYIGGCAATSNVLAAKIFDIPVSGTHAHSWVMAFASELEAFDAYADAFPGNCVLLVDTFNTLQGVEHAVEIGRKLRARGKELAGIRLDSGDLAYLSQQARKMLDEAGFRGVKIVASNDIDEKILTSLFDQDARIDLFGIGTRLVTAYDQPALGGVYKLAAMKDKAGQWQNKIKLSEQAVKINNPGIQQVRRYKKDGMFYADMIYDERRSPDGDITLIHPCESTKRKVIRDKDFEKEDLLVPVFRKGKCVYSSPGLKSIRERVHNQLEQLHPGVKRFINPHTYIVGLERSLCHEKNRLILEARKLAEGGDGENE